MNCNRGQDIQLYSDTKQDSWCDLYVDIYPVNRNESTYVSDMNHC